MYGAGALLLWHEFPFPNDAASDIKDRWFICLGTSGLFSTPVFLYLCTPTTKIEKYAPGAERANHTFIRIQKGEHGFPQECVIDIPFNFIADIQQSDIEAHIEDIEEKGTVAPDLLRRIFKLIVASRSVPRKVKLDIRDALNRIAITGLKVP